MKGKHKLVEIQIGKIKLDCKVFIPEYTPDTRWQPAEGGIKELEITNIYYKGFEVFELINEVAQDVIETIIDKCKEKLK